MYKYHGQLDRKHLNYTSFKNIYFQVVDENALKPEVQEYLGRGKPKTELKVRSPQN